MIFRDFFGKGLSANHKETKHTSQRVNGARNYDIANFLIGCGKLSAPNYSGRGR